MVPLSSRWVSLISSCSGSLAESREDSVCCHFSCSSTSNEQTRAGKSRKIMSSPDCLVSLLTSCSKESKWRIRQQVTQRGQKWGFHQTFKNSDKKNIFFSFPKPKNLIACTYFAYTKSWKKFEFYLNLGAKCSNLKILFFQIIQKPSMISKQEENIAD